jgi:hypothetical protein
LTRTTSALLALTLVGCATVQIPLGQESERTFVRDTSKPYQEVYRVVAKQMRACYRVLGVFGNGYDIQADLDSSAKTGTIELYPVGLTGAQKPEDSIFSRTVLITATATGATIKTTGTTPKYVYLTHMTIPTWLNGIDSCAP